MSVYIRSNSVHTPLHFMKITLLFLSISFVFPAEIRKQGRFEALIEDEYLFPVYLSQFFAILDQSALCSVSKSVRRLFRKPMIRQVMREYRAFFPDIPINFKLLKEFEIVWKFNRFSNENLQSEWIKRQKVLRSTCSLFAAPINEKYTPNPINSNFFCRVSNLYDTIHFPSLTLELLKKGKTNNDRSLLKQFIPKILSRPEFYNEALLFLAKEVHKCSRNELPYHIRSSQDLFNYHALNLIDYNYRAKTEIVDKHHSLAALELSQTALVFMGLALLGVENGFDVNILAGLVGLYVVLAARIFYSLNVDWMEEYESFK